ncbi:phage tail assembly chaperone [Comamonas testosteroni]|uniref:Phage tail assembly chaperone-like domain-containing protein n=1 Tax=Comamonas testosteroni TaxID=285 RepID=A0A096GRC5_COMTE|nr:phage tail assembly chaperone [Comamonas testosteroni]KGH27765.1 hypothetical protein P353_17245 [Comamonas testosteroni]
MSAEVEQQDQPLVLQVTVVDELGRVVHELVCSPDQLQANVPQGCRVVDGVSGGDWWDGAVWRHKPEPPSPHAQWDWKSLCWVMDSAQAADAAWRDVRLERDARLAATDWRVVRAIERGQALSLEWQIYRQALREITTQTDPQNIHWPELPKEE